MDTQTSYLTTLRPSQMESIYIPDHISVVLDKFIRDLSDYERNINPEVLGLSGIIHFRKQSNEIRAFVVRLAERVLTKEETDFILTANQLALRYSNMQVLYYNLNNVSYVIRNVIMNIEHYPQNQKDESPYYFEMNQDYYNNKFLLSIKTYVRAMRHFENRILEDYPNFITLPVQPFEH